MSLRKTFFSTALVAVISMFGCSGGSNPPADATAGIDVVAPGDSAASPVLAPCDAGPSGPTQNCGWVVEASRSCTPGARVDVGCNAGCTPALGACTGDPMLRVCAGDAPCASGDALVQNDDSSTCTAASTSLCPSGTFTCPTAGRYTVMTTSADLQSYTCTVAVR
jgi:hypothetical protein